MKLSTGGAAELSHKTAQSFTLSTQPLIFVHNTNDRVSLSLHDLAWHMQQLLTKHFSVVHYIRTLLSISLKVLAAFPHHKKLNSKHSA